MSRKNKEATGGLCKTGRIAPAALAGRPFSLLSSSPWPLAAFWVRRAGCSHHVGQFLQEMAARNHSHQVIAVSYLERVGSKIFMLRIFGASARSSIAAEEIP